MILNTVFIIYYNEEPSVSYVTQAYSTFIRTRRQKKGPAFKNESQSNLASVRKSIMCICIFV